MAQRVTTDELKGVWCFAVTPFTEKGGRLVLDETGVANLARFVSGSGVPVIVPCGGTGEFHSLAFDEWSRTVQIVLEEVGREKVVIPGVGGTLNETVAMAQEAARLGARAVMAMPPAEKGSEGGLYEYYAAVTRAVDIGVVLYNTVNAPLTPSLLRRLGEMSNVVALKDEAGDLRWFEQVMRDACGRFAGVCGLGESMAPFYYLLGAVGYTSGVSCVVPRAATALHEAMMSSDYAGAMAIRERLIPLTEMRARPGRHIPVIKAALFLMGVIASPAARLPLVALDEREEEELTGILKYLGAQPPGGELKR